MIQYIVAAGLGALIGSAQKGKKKYKKGGAVMKKDPATKREILRESDGIMDDADDLIRIADKKRLDRDDKMGIQTLADEMKFSAGNIYDTAQRKLAKGGKTPLLDADEVLKHFVMAMLFTGTDDEGMPLDDNYDFDDVNKTDLTKARELIEKFLHQNAEIIEKHNLSAGFVGHDLWMSPTGQGVGFWDRHSEHPTLTEEEGDALDESSKKIMGTDMHAIEYDGEVEIQGLPWKYAKGGATDDLGNPTDPSVIQQMEVFIEKEIPKLDEDRYFTYGMKRKEAKRRFYEKYGYGAYGMRFGLAKGGKTMDKGRRKMAQGGLAIHFDDDYTHKDEIENLLMSKTYMRDNENLTDYGSSFYVYADDIGTSGVRDVYNLIVENGYDDNVELEPFAKGGKTQGYNARLDESLAMRRGSKRTKKQGYKSRRHESEGMERSMGRRKYASVGTMDKGRRRMAKGGVTDLATETLKKWNEVHSEKQFNRKVEKNQAFNAFKKANNVDVKADQVVAKVFVDGEQVGFAFLISNTTGKPLKRLKFIPSMAKGGCTSCGKRGRKMADGGRVGDKEFVLDHYYVYVEKDVYEEGVTDEVASWDSSDYGESNKSFSSKSALMDFIKEVIDRDTSEDDTKESNFDIESDEDGTTINYGVLCKYNDLDRGYDHYEKATREEIEQWKKGGLELFYVGFTFKVKVYEPRKSAEFARGGKTQGYNARLDESLSMRHGAGIKKEQGRKDRRDESEAMERSMRRRKYASVGTMDKGRRKMAHGGEVEVSRRAREIGSLTGVRANAIQNFVNQNNLDIERLLRFVQKGTLTDRMDLMTAIVGNPNNKVQKRIIKDFKMAHGGKTQGYNARLDESLSMRHGAGRKKEQGRKDRRDESEAMERSMGRRKYASVGTMDKGRRKMEDGGMVEYLLYGVAQGKPDYMEEILFVDDKPIRITEKLRDMASAKGFDRLRTSMVDLKIAPDFTKALNFKKGGKTKGRKKVSDFDKLAMKVAARYRAQGMSNEKAMEIGRGTAGKVARQQQAKKRKK